MKLLRYGGVGQEKPGAIDRKGTLRDLSGHIADISGAMLLPDSLEQLKKLDLESLPAVEGSQRLGPCAGGVGKVIAIGLNYAHHTADAGDAVTNEPVIFKQDTRCL